ncbi:MAG: hypothetical protein ACJAYK_000886 [Crocinitomicaceae bacterium]|jgi:hypothetical protein
MLQSWLESVRVFLQQISEPQKLQPIRIKAEEQQVPTGRPARRRR